MRLIFIKHDIWTTAGTLWDQRDQRYCWCVFFVIFCDFLWFILLYVFDLFLIAQQYPHARADQKENEAKKTYNIMLLFFIVRWLPSAFFPTCPRRVLFNWKPSLILGWYARESAINVTKWQKKQQIYNIYIIFGVNKYITYYMYQLYLRVSCM